MTPSPGSARPASVGTVIDAGDVALRATVHAPQGLPVDAPVVVAVHGYPDTARVWDRVVAALTPDFRVVTYDVRGAGGSSTPADTAGYRTERLVDDLVCVLDVATPDRAPVHLLGHDWGSVQLWDVVCAEESDTRLTGRIASYTSISGPSLDHAAAFIGRAPAAVVRYQRRRSWYVAAFQLPLLPELVCRHAIEVTRRAMARAERLDTVDGPRGHWAESLGADAEHGLELYRANVLRRLRSPGPGHTRVPVQLVVPRRDRFVTPASLAYVAEAVPRLQRVDVDAGHWVARTDPSLVAGLVRSFAARVGSTG